MATLGSLAVNIVARTDRFTKGITKSISLVGKFSKSVTAAGAKIAKFGVIGGAAVGGISAAMIKLEINAVDKIAKFSDKLGIATEKLVGLRLAAEETGVGADTMQMAIQRATRRIAEAAGGKGEAVGALTELGLSASFLNRLSPDQQLLRIADAMNKVESQSDKVRLAFKLFDSEGVAMVNMLKLGRDGLLETQDAANKLGLTITRDMAAAVERANDAIGRMVSAFRGLFRQIAVRVSPMIEKLSKTVVEFLTNEDRINKFADSIARGLVKVFGVVLDMVLRVRLAITQMVNQLGKAAQVFSHSSIAKYAGLGDKERESLLKFGIKTSLDSSAQASSLRTRLGIGTDQDSEGTRFANDLIATFDKWKKDLADNAKQSAKTNAAEEERAKAMAKWLQGKASGIAGKVSGFDPMEAIKGIGKSIGQATLLPKEAASTVAGFIADNTNGPRHPQFAGAALRGSAEARSAILRGNRDNPIMKVAKVNEKQLDELKEIKENLKGGGPAQLQTKSFAAEA